MGKAMIIASRNGNVFILQTSQTKGYVVNLDGDTVSEEMEIDAFLKFGYWEPYNGSIKGEELLKVVNRHKRNSISDKSNAVSIPIEKDEIIKLLRKYSKVPRAGLSSEIDFSIEDEVLKVYIKNPIQNMQNRGVAFEGWVLVLKRWLSNKIRSVDVDFKAYDNLAYKYGFLEAGHYNRFLYRLYNMSKFFPAWFSINKSKKSIVDNFMQWIKSNKTLLNHSRQERESVIETTNMERQIESWFVFHEGKSLLTKRWNIDPDKLFNQLPAGVFVNTIAADNAIFPSGSSAVDMWGVDKDGETLHLIELKCGANDGLGVIGETLFYTALIYDTYVADETLFDLGKYDNASYTKDTVAIKSGGKKFNHIFAHILAEKHHSLFDDVVVEKINKGLSNFNMSFDRATYNYTKKVFTDENNCT